MRSGQTSIEPILREIDLLDAKIRKAVVEEHEEYKRTRALMLLEGVGQVFRAFCFAPSPDDSYEEFEFNSGGRSRGKPRGKSRGK